MSSRSSASVDRFPLRLSWRDFRTSHSPVAASPACSAQVVGSTS